MQSRVNCAEIHVKILIGILNENLIMLSLGWALGRPYI